MNMNLTILYEPYVLFLIISILISIAYYFYESNKNKNKEETPKKSVLPQTIVSLLVSYIVMLMSYFCYKYFHSFSSPTVSMSGGNQEDEINELNDNELIELCKLVNQYPTKILTIEKMEYYLVKKYNKKYRDYYENLVNGNKLWYLLEKIYSTK